MVLHADMARGHIVLFAVATTSGENKLTGRGCLADAAGGRWRIGGLVAARLFHTGNLSIISLDLQLASTFFNLTNNVFID